MPVQIGSASPAQIPAVLTFWREAAEVASSTDDLPGLTALCAHDPGALLVATDGDLIVGSLIASWDGWRAGLYRLAVLPSHRRRGVGRALVAEGESRLRRRGARRINLFAVESHQGAVTFWNSLGYHHNADDERFVRDLLEPPPT
jgi:ribosomal protein S18 acetylase RimI-like enzyme